MKSDLIDYEEKYSSLGGTYVLKNSLQSESHSDSDPDKDSCCLALNLVWYLTLTGAEVDALIFWSFFLDYESCWIFTFFFFFSCTLLLLITFLSFSIVDFSQWNGSVEWNDKVHGPYIVVSKWTRSWFLRQAI